MNTRSFIFFTRILARAQISSLIFRELFYWGFIGHNFGDYKNGSHCQTWMALGFIGHNFGDYKNLLDKTSPIKSVLSVTILETTKTLINCWWKCALFYRSQFWRLQKLPPAGIEPATSFIGHNFGDYKNLKWYQLMTPWRCAVTRLFKPSNCLQAPSESPHFTK